MRTQGVVSVGRYEDVRLRRKKFVVGGKSAGKSAFGPRCSPSVLLPYGAYGASASRLELRRRERLRRDKTDRQTRRNPLTTVNAFGTADFDDAPTPTDIFRETRRQTSSALGVNAFVGRDAFGAAGQRRRRKEFAFGVCTSPSSERERRSSPSAVRDGCE
ncbi:hypothetical protein AXG93_2587s1690 [Marchantia polymorpha subsp. ruderalis]|uniref:Uncharacterized protein n=1 Tax=Marchantia polymorpha subsp. ruderalis TaxID=1480154 RepID=A0A176WSD1_MARPO|nr:hypothetical protein AXG93_2587s1690 [Marchantia polymorpha subsp. ruderalis]